jgi:hypothetical protein
MVQWVSGLTACLAWREGDPRDHKDAGDYNGGQDPYSDRERCVCERYDVHSDFPLFNLMEIQKTRRTISPGVDSGLSHRPFAVVRKFESIFVLVDLRMWHL